MAQRVVVAMSGGVDSSVAAALLKEQGHEVIGITLNLWPKLSPEQAIERPDACCSLSAVEDARRVADKLGIPHYVLNFRDVFEKTVIQDFVQEYVAGRTPNPCIRCNEFVKFDALLTKATGLGADFVATGHYARVRHDPSSNRFLLQKAADAAKDQTYVLYVLKQHQLAHTLMPLGDFTKASTRKMAHRLSLPVAEKAESQEICFVTENDYGLFLLEQVPEGANPGPIEDRHGHVLGHHKGIMFYTIGQRRGLGLTAPEPLYVVDIRPEANVIVVGPEEELYHQGLLADRLNLISLDRLPDGMPVKAKIRYRSPEAPAEVQQMADDLVAVRFEQPQRAITPGQAVVFYQGDTVVGGATIARWQ